MTLAPGTRLGPYEISTPLGAGGMGEVFRARDTRLGREVAIKVLPPAIADEPDRVTRFEREARLLASLNHPNIAALYGVEQQEGRLCLVLELIEGESLAERVRRGPLGLDEASEIAAQIASALEAAHDAGVVHRDLKPGNVMLRPDGVAKVLDFGLARGPAAPGEVASSSHSPTMTSPATMPGMILGTAAYMSPEQARGRTTDKRADVWAWGCVFYELLTGRHAFPGEDVSETLAAILKTEPDWSALPPQTPRRVRELLVRCLKKDPRERLRDAGDARLLLAEARTHGSEPPADPAARPRFSPLSAIALVLVAAFAGVVATKLVSPEPTPAPAALSIQPPAGVRFGNASNDFVISPDGRWVVFTGIDSAGTQQLWLRELARDNARPLSGTVGASQPFWSPDSRALGFFAGGKLITLNMMSGAMEPLCDAPLPRGGAWGKGFIVFQPRSLGPLMKISERGGAITAVTVVDSSAGESGHRFPSMLPDGRHFLYAILPPKESLHVIAVGSLSGEPGKPVTRADAGAVYAAPGYLLFGSKGAMRAQRFDARSFRVTGPELAVPGLRTLDPMAGGAPVISASTNGIVVQLAAEDVPLRLAWMHRDGRLQQPLAVPAGIYSHGAISPDGRKAAWEYVAHFDGQTSLWVVDLARVTIQRMTFEGESYTPVWSPDGRQLAFTRPTNGRQSLWSMSADSPGSERLRIELPNLYNSLVDWTPDGSGIIHRTQGMETRQDIMFAMLADSAGERPLIATRFNELHGTLSPDGHWLAYLSDETGQLELSVRAFPALDRQTRVSPSGAWAEPTMSSRVGRPLWSRDGRELLYLAADGRTMLAVEVRPGDPLEFGVPRPLFRLPAETADLCASPDLERFLLAIPQAGQGQTVGTILVGWPGLLEPVK